MSASLISSAKAFGKFLDPPQKNVTRHMLVGDEGFYSIHIPDVMLVR